MENEHPNQHNPRHEDSGIAEFEETASIATSGGPNPDFMSQRSLNLAGDVAGFTEQLLPVPPDGGYGWIIVIAAFFSNLIVDGIATCFAEFKSYYIESFKASDALVSTINSMLIGCYLLVGPFVGGMVNKLGAKKTVMIGAVISGTSFILSTFSPNIYVFIFLYGVLGGAGFGMIYLPAIVVVGYWFEKKRAVATGIAVAGSGAGTIVMPFFAKFVIEGFDRNWKMGVYGMAALIFTCIAFAMLYRELSSSVTASNVAEVEMLLLKAGEDVNGDVDSPKTNGDAKGAGDDVKMRSGSQSRPRKATISSVSSEMASNKDLSSSRGQLNANGQLSRISARSFAQSMSKLSRSGQSNLSLAMSGVDPHEFSKPMNRQDIFYGGSVTKLNKYKEEGDAQSYRASIVNIPSTVVGEAVLASHPNLHEAGIAGSRISHMAGGLGAEDLEQMELEDNGMCKCLPLSLRTTMSQMFDLSLLKNPIMQLICWSNLLGMMGFYIPFVFIKDLAMHKNVSEADATYLVPIIGVTNTVGRVICGWLADRQFVTSLTINNFSLVTCGLLCFIAPHCNTFASLAAYASAFGLIISAYICLTSIVLADLLGIEKLTSSFGLLVVYRGIACFLGTPFAGFAYDKMKSYDVCFYIGGIIILISGLISCTIPLVDRYLRSRGENEGDFVRGPAEYADNMSGKLSVLTERSEEALTEYQRTIQSLRQQHALLQEMEEMKRQMPKNNPSQQITEDAEEQD